jgi:hypothetical protein
MSRIPPVKTYGAFSSKEHHDSVAVTRVIPENSGVYAVTVRENEDEGTLC